eukprot:TRINITY_DN2281_c0_g2_i2.p2 TRINITY_DN2281_c0_g2~~TRINITY_DN2281_c0_g2_i2.p2  ORF type:complete len:229 (-),score=42.06 TRINITY_DN2281_c0_g2_i2:81-767(-)
MGFPAFFDHRPVGIVAIHGDVLPAAAGSDASIEAVTADFGQEGFEGHDVIKGTGFRHIAAIEQRMNAHGPDAFGLGLDDHGLQVVDVAMHIAIGEKADEMHDATASLGPGNNLLPGLAPPDGAIGNRIGNQRGALAIDLTGTDGVVANFGITHVVVRRHADSRAVGTQANVRVIGKQAVEGRLPGRGDGAADVGLGQAVAVHHDDNDRALDAGKGGELRQHEGIPAEK